MIFFVAATQIENTLQFRNEINSEKFTKMNDIARGRDIALFFGVTGSGKSATINYLALPDDDLIANNFNQIALAPATNKGLKIGLGGNSQTTDPEFMQTEDGFIYCDVPGLNDTRGSFIHLRNLALIKNILTTANSVRFACIVSEAELESSRGEQFKKLLNMIYQLFGRESEAIMRASSILIVTKNTQKHFVLYLAKIIPDEYRQKLDIWKDRIFCINKPRDEIIDPTCKAPICNALKGLPASTIHEINMEALYTHEIHNALRNVLFFEMDELLKPIEEINSDASISTLETRLAGLENFWGKLGNKLSQSNVFSILYKLSENHCNSVFNEYQRQNQHRILLLRNDLERAKNAKISEFELRARDVIKSEIYKGITAKKASLSLSGGGGSLDDQRKRLETQWNKKELEDAIKNSIENNRVIQGIKNESGHLIHFIDDCIKKNLIPEVVRLNQEVENRMQSISQQIRLARSYESRIWAVRQEATAEAEKQKTEAQEREKALKHS